MYPDEVEAVLSYFMMEIGWFCYQINYTKDEEDQINSRRRLRERKIKEKKNQQVAKAKGPSKLGISKLNGNIVSLDQSSPPKASVSCGLQTPKPSVSQTGPSVDMKRISKLKTRWDKSPEQYDILKFFKISMSIGIYVLSSIKFPFQNQRGLGAEFSKQVWIFYQ